jgi:hypothetical protein
MNASTISRGYHESAVLLTDGSVLVAGCDACISKLKTPAAAFQSPNPTNHTEYRVEIFRTPYHFDRAHQPRITAINSTTSGSISMRLGQTGTLRWTGTYNVTTLALVAPGTSTHGFNANQRVIFLPLYTRTYTSSTAGTVSFRMPGNPSVVIPQWYMLFALNGKTFGRSWWVHVRPA